MATDDFPHVMDRGRRRSLRFAVPKISFGPDTLASYEATAGVSYVELLEHVLAVDLPEETPEGIHALVKSIKKTDKAVATAQGMLFYLANLETAKSRVDAIQPPLSSSMVTHWRMKYEFFDATVNDFEEEMSDIAEQELYNRAVHGSDSPMVVNGNVEYVVKKSDDLLKYYLTHNRPKRYSQKTESVVKQKTELSGPDGGPVAMIVDRTALKNMSDEDLAKLEELLSKSVGE